MTPKVSVIIPMYNAAHYLAETLHSIFTQSYQNFEVLLIDDGSTDDTLKVAKTYEPRARIFSQTNKGPSAARNMGFRHARGEYIAWLDSDDLWHQDLLKIQVDYLDNHPQIGLVYAESWAFIQQGGRRIIVDKVGYTEKPNLKLLLHGDCIPTNTVLLRRSCYENIGGMNESLIRAEDYEYLMRLSYYYEFVGISRPLAFYRWHSDSLVGDNRDVDRGLQDAMIALKNIEQRHSDIWQITGVNRAELLARLQIRAAHAWKNRDNWRRALSGFLRAFQYSRHPVVIRWIIAAALLKRWS